MKRFRLHLLAVAFLLPAAASAQTLQERFVRLADAQGVSGYEADVRAAVRAQLPEWAASMAKVDEIGNLTLTVGSREPRTILAAYLDEGGYVVSRITDDGYLRLHRHTVRVVTLARHL